jgi:ribosomal protein S3AE
MDKALFRAYVKELVKEQIEESVEKAVKKILPEILGEAVAEIKQTQVKPVNETAIAKQKLSRSQLAQMMGLERLGDTITATAKNVGPVIPTVPEGIDPNNPVVQAINKDYSALMKAMKLT